MPVVVYSDAIEGFSFGQSHPFRLDRGRLFLDSARSLGLLENARIVQAAAAGAEDLCSFHKREYIDTLKSANTGELDMSYLDYGLGLHDNPVFKGVFDLCKLFGGVAETACELILSGESTVFAPVGGFHHAMRGRAGGFCYINDIGLAIERLLAAGKKVLYVDIDAHHGDGIQNAYYEDGRVLKLSFHETGRTLFPFGGSEDETGAGPGLYKNVNVPLHSTSDDEIFLWLFKNIFPPIIDRFEPDVTVAQIGVDMMSTDPLSHLRLTNNSYIEAIRHISMRSDHTLFFGGGGYNADNIVKGYTLAWAVMNSMDLDDDYASATLGGTFLGSTETGRVNSLRDMNIFLSGPDKDIGRREAERVYTRISETVFKGLGIKT
jgi:acetoin utilization protein AcuC